MSNFCRITGHTRGLPKTNHFFPILPPISPAEAKKYKSSACRITSNFNPNHNYIPIKSYLDINHASKCTITRNSLFKYKHFQFIVPKMNSKSAVQYFYMLDSKVLLVPDEIEMQLNKGIITDIKISNHTIGFKYNYKVKEYDLEVLSELMEDNLLFKTCKYTDDIHPGKGLKCVKKRTVGKRKGSIAALTQLFKDKEKKAEMDELKAAERIAPDHGKMAKVKGKLDERRKSVQIAPDTISMEIDEDDAPPPTKYLLHSGEVVDEVNKENQTVVKASVCGHTVVNGKVIDGLFTPGMVVKTDAADKFIPGVMVDSHFTPGQMLEVSPGNKKFIPGQVIDIQGTNKFVPGQLILEDDTGAFKFVPGRVEQGEFYPGEIVETQEGLKFVCEVFNSNEFELQTFELENPVLFEVQDVKTLMEQANIVPVEFNECCEVIFEQAVFEKRVDERVINNAKEKLKERCVNDLLEAIEFARLLGKNAIASELEGVLQADEDTRNAVLSDSSVKLLLTQLVVLKGIVGGRVGEVGEEELGKAIYKSNVVAKVLVDEGVTRGSVENSHSANSLDRTSDGTGVPSSGTVEAEDLREESADPMEGSRTVIKQTFSSRSVETHDGAVIEFQSHHAVTEYRATGGSGETIQEASALSTSKRQRLGMQKPASLDLDSIPPESVELLDTTPAKHKLSLARQMRHKSGSSVSSVGSEKKSKIILKSGEEMLADPNLAFKNERDLILYELLETEEEFVRELDFVMGSYYKEIEASVVFNKYRDLLFEDFKLIHQFHSTSLLEAIRYYSDDPKMIAKSFLRLERDFEPHVRYYQDHIKIEEVISNDLDLLEFIEDLSVSKRISDTKSLADHLKLPLQRINDYVLIFKDLLDVCSRIHDDELEREVLSRVLEFLVAIPQKLDDRKFLNSIEGIDASVLGKLGRLLGHDWFVVTDKSSPSSSEGSKNRYVFLFKQKLLVTKVRRISDHRSVFILKQALHLPEYEVEQIGKGFRLFKEAREILFEASEKESGVQSWVAEISKYTKKEGVEVPKDVVQIVVLEGGSSKSETSEDETIGAVGGVQIVEIVDSEIDVVQALGEQNKSGQDKTGVVEEKTPAKVKAPTSEKVTPAETKPAAEKKSGQDKTVVVEAKGTQEKVTPERKPAAEKPAPEIKKEATKVEAKAQEKVAPAETKKAPAAEKPAPETKKEAAAEKPSEQKKPAPEAKKEAAAEKPEQKKPAPEAKKEAAAEKPAPDQKKPAPVTKQGSKEQEKPVDKQPEQTGKKGSVKKEEVKSVSRQNSSTESKKSESTQEKVESKPPTAPPRVDRQKSEQEKVKEVKMADDEAPPNPAQLLRRRSSVIMAKPGVESTLKFVEPIQSIECEPGENASFRLKVSSASTIITWLKGNRPLEDKLADRVKIESKGAVHSLTILNVNDNDGGLYTAKVCELVGKDGAISEPVSSSAVLVVHELTPEERAKKIAERDSPQFLVKFKDTELLKHTTVNFMFLVKGNPEPEVVFKRNKEVLSTKGRVSISPHGVGKYEMKIEKIEDTDAGTYTVIATNKHGVTEVNAVVKVVDEKDVFNEGTAMKPDGEGAERKGLLKPGEEPIFTWFKDGKVFEPGEDFKVLFKDEEDTLALVFQHVKPEDAGMYTCVASTTSGRISCSAELTVQGGINQLLKEPSKPQITAKLTDTEVSLGGSAMLELKVTGFPKPDIVWFKDKTQLEAGGRFRFLYEDDESIALIIKNVNYDDEGVYKVVAKNDLGEASTSGNLVIRQPPKFMKKMTDTEMMAGESFNMEVEVEGNPKPELKWYKDGQLIVSSERIKFTQSKDGQKYIMSIERVTLDDTGAYSVVASNAVGQMSEFWNVLATMPARFTERLPGNVVCDKGAKGFEYVVKTAGVPDPKLEVKLCGKELKYEKIEHQVYKIKVPEITELKDYDLVASATNQFAKDETVCVFNVNRGVKIVDGLKEVIVKEHGSATVGVKVDCYPKPKNVKWFIDGVEISGKAYETKEEAGGVYSLTVKDAYKETGCRYDVKVMLDNGLGAGESSGTITMQAPPVITKGLSAVNRLEFNTVQELNVTLKETTPTPKGIWFHNGQEVTADARIKISKKSTETYTLTFDCVKYEDAGEWSFKAVNDIGEVMTKTTVIVEGKPQITSPLPNSMRILETETYDLEVNILDYCEENVKIEWKSNVETVFKPIIACKRDGNEYHSKVTFVPNRKENYFKVVATNKYGETESLCQIDWIALVPPKILTPMQDSYIIQDGDAFKFESEVEGVPKPKIVWLYNGEIMKENVNGIEGIVQKATVGEYTLQAVNVAGEAISKTRLNVLQTQPTISNLSENYAFKENEDDLVLSIDITGSPIPTVTWLHNGVPIDLNDPRVSVVTTPTKSTLTVKKAAKADKGAYSAQVSNQNGTAEGKAQVAITFVPEIDGKITYPDLVTKNTRFELKANVSGEPFPEVEWVHPTGKLIKESEPGVHELKVYPDGNVVLAIESAQMTDGGVYKLVARNSRGEIVVPTGIVNVEAARTRPRINPPLPPQIKLIEGHPLTLRTTVKAHPIPELALKFEDSVLPYEQRTIENGLEFEHKCEKVSTSGTFSLKATNSEGSTESECRLIVIPRLKEGALKAPEFVSELNDKVVNEGDELVIIAKVDGNPIPEVEVIVNGKPIDVRDVLEFDGNSLKYRIPDTRMSDAGEYKIVLKSSEGQAESKCNVKVNKVFKAPEFLQKFTDQAQMPTRDCKFGAKVSGFPIPNVRWLKDGNEIDTSRADKYRAKHEDETVVLQVRNCDDSDIGVYTCELSNVEGTASCRAKLDVVDNIPPAGPRTEAPYFLKTIGSTEVYPGMQSKFTACVGGNPDPDFEWFKDGNRMHEAQGSRIQFVRDGIGAGLIKLIINDTNIGDIGDYRLRIFNDLGEASCSALLKFDTFDVKRREQSPLGDYYIGYSDLRPTALPDRPVITRMDERSVTLNWKSAIPNVHSQHPCTYTLEIAPADGVDWKPVYTGLKNTYADVDFPSSTLDYKFRVRVQWGDRYISEPSPYVITNRNKLNLPALQWSPMVIPSIPRTYDLSIPPHPQYTHAPRFLNNERETQYGCRNTPASVQFAIYGYPKPTLSFRFNGSPVTLNHTYTDNGIVTIYLNEMNEQKIGCYECIATNSHGVATQAIELRLTDLPRFLEHLKETHVCARKNGKIHCVVTGIPCPTIRLYKDWNATPRSFQQVQLDENTVSVTVLFEDTLLRDEGMYSIVATNHAGSTHSSALVRIHEDETAYNWNSYGVRPRVLRLRKSDPDEFYHFGNLIGRGTQGTHYHVVETRTGTAWAAKRMLIDESNSLHRNMIETEIENWACVNSPHVVRLYDGFFDNRTFTLINELCTGGDLFGYLIYELEDFDETVIKRFVEQILMGVRDLHETKLWHCSLQPLDILLTHKRSSQIKLTDLGVSRFNDPQPNRYSHPEFASPELISQSGINWKTDMWSVGVIAYILLTGHHPYVGLNDQETMENLKNWNGQINETHLSRLSSNAIDFLRTLLRITANERPSACEALEHSWFKTTETRMVNLFNESHVKYYTHLRAWQSNADCVDRFRRNPLEVAYKHVSKMVYPPGYDWVDESTIRVITKSDYSFPRPYVEIDDFVSESHYQSGDDTYLLQLRDTDFPARLRQYMKVAANSSPSFALHFQNSYFDRNIPVIRERRKFTDIMDEEVDDEKRARIVEYGEGPINSEPRRLRHEVGSRMDIQAEAEAIMSMKREGREPCFRERPRSISYVEEYGQDFTLNVVVDGDPGAPDVQWFRGDTLLLSDDPVHRRRLEVISTVDNTLVRTQLLIRNLKNTDLCVYKCTARNKQGQITWKFRTALLPDTLRLPSPNPPLTYSLEKTPTPLSTEVHNFESVSTPEVVLKGCFTNVLKSGPRVYKLSTNEEYEIVRKLIHTHVLGGEYTQAIQIGSGVACSYDTSVVGLLDHLVGLGSYTEQTVVSVVEQILHGLSYLHWCGVAGIGLSASSYAVDKQGVVKIIDLSSAQKISRVGVASEAIGKRTNVAANLEYIAPEALSATDTQVCGQSDIWSVGVLIYVLLSGASPFKGDNEDETKQNILFVRFRFEHLYKDLSQEVTRLIMMIFKRSPLKRPSAEECFEHRWFHPTESLTKKRQRVVFTVDKLEAYLNSVLQDEEVSSTAHESNGVLQAFYNAHHL